jgi:hypothetical protein
MTRLVLVAPLLVCVACGPAPQADAGPDPADAGAADAGAPDAGADDAGFDAGPSGPAPGFGDITGPCGALDDELGDAAPSFHANAIDFGTDPYDDADYGALTAGGQEIIDDGNAGGSSLLSEVFAFELLARCEGATLLKTETEIAYTDPQGKITDLLVDIDGRTLGVSVTRAIAFPFDDPYTVAQAQTLLEDKLQGVLDSTANVAASDAWDKQILSVIAYTPAHADAFEQAWAAVDSALRADTIVYVTATDGDDAPLY